MTSLDLAACIRQVLVTWPGIRLAILYGSAARGKERFDSDLDVAVWLDRPLDVDEKMRLVRRLVGATGRSVDLTDLAVVGEPLLGQILVHGKRVLGDNGAYGDLLALHLRNAEDFLPYRRRILRARRRVWIGM